MRRTVKDYELLRTPEPQQVPTFRGAQPLRVACERGRLFLWMEVDTDRPAASMTFSVHDTGEEIETRQGFFPPTYVGTGDADLTMCHVYHHASRS